MTDIGCFLMWFQMRIAFFSVGLLIHAFTSFDIFLTPCLVVVVDETNVA